MPSIKWLFVIVVLVLVTGILASNYLFSYVTSINYGDSSGNCYLILNDLGNNK